MTCNVSRLERAFRFAIGITLVAWAAAGGPVWAWTGLIFIATGAWRFCPLYYGLGINTSRRRKVNQTREPGS